MNRLWKIFTSLRLTVVLLGLGIVLVWVGTVAQADEGLYQAQSRYFKHWYVWGLTLFGHKVPLPLPGGYTIGVLLLVNLVSAHIKRFQWSAKKFGIHLTHAGVILLLVGQLFTDVFSRETQLRFFEGQSKTWSESATDYELAFTTDAGGDAEEVVVIPQKLLMQAAEKGVELKDAKLPVGVRVKSWWKNSRSAFRAPMQANQPPLTTNGLARHFDFRQTGETKSMDSKNIPTALLELASPAGPLGTWIASGWAGDEVMVDWTVEGYEEEMGPQLAKAVRARLTEPQGFEAGGKRWALTLRPARTYNPYSLTLLKPTHSVYVGTVTSATPEGIPKDFRSRVRIENPQTRENREVEIYMNSPLRYAGLTFFQLQMDASERTRQRGRTPSSTLQVVRNPAWLTPYAGCGIVGAGLVIQFMIHLVGFVSRRKTK
ncbi:MAG: cytochrome c biogenesis protein ResB [Verrucomicrobia bacterium]|nr:cytochrome c biogenesis protein ResB [Verrucomicrobiota bacterium]